MFTIGVPGHVFSHTRSSLAVYSHRQNAPSLNPFTCKVATTTVNSNILKSTTLLRSFATILTTSLFLDLEKGSFGNSGGSDGGSGGKSGGGRHGGEGEIFGSWSLCPVAIADENQSKEWDSHGLPANIIVQLNKLRGFKRYKVFDIQWLDNNSGTDDLLFKMVSLHPGGVYTKSQLEEELKTLHTIAMSKKIDLLVTPNPDGTISVSILLRKDYKRELQQILTEKGKDSVRLLQKITDKFQQRSHDNSNYARLVEDCTKKLKEVVPEVMEGDTTQMMKLQKQLHYITESGKQGLKNISWLAPFFNINDEKKMFIKTDIKKVEKESTEVGPDWSTISERFHNGRTFAMEIRNFNDLNTRILSSATINNFLNLNDYLGMKVECVYPYFEGDENPYNRIIRTSYFHTRNTLPTSVGEAPLSVYRNGVKANITENITVNSKGTYGVQLEAIKEGRKPSGKKIDHIAFIRGDITTDNTKLINGAIIGQKHVIQADQGIVIGNGYLFPFNRYQCSTTRYIPLKGVEEGVGKSPPPVLMVHGKYGMYKGISNGYVAFRLGERYSLNVNNGVLGGTRQFLKVGAELRIPVKKTLVYAFAEHENDVWAYVSTRNACHGSSYGFGIKWGLLRAELARDHNAHSWQPRLTIIG